MRISDWSSDVCSSDLSGVVLTRMDGDARGGAALSMRAVTGRPIKFVGVGEKLDALDTFDPRRVAGRILGMGDVVSLVEKAAETMEQDRSEEHTSELQSLMRISYAVLCLKKKKRCRLDA